MSSDGAHRLLCALVVVLGVALRVLGYFGNELQLWLDEAWWAVRLVNGDFPWLRPAGYMWVTGALVDVLNVEQTLRSLSLVGGLLHVPLTLAVLRLSTSSRWLALFGAYVVAVHPVAIAMSKEFKPFALELSFHLLLLYFALAYVRSDRRAHVVGLVVTAIVAPFFAWSVVFAYPAVFAVVGLRALRGSRVVDVALTASGAALTLAGLSAISLARAATDNQNANYWGRKYDVFYVGASPPEAFGWLVAKTLEVASFPAHLEVALPASPLQTGVVTALAWLCVALSIVGAVELLARRRWALSALWIMPWLLAVAINVTGNWPWGVFRTNLFMLAYAIGLVSHGLAAMADHVSPPAERPDPAAALGLVLVALLLLPLDASPFQTKPRNTEAFTSSVRTAMERIYTLDHASEHNGRRILVLDWHACGTFRYYAGYHAETKQRLGAFFAPTRFAVSCSSAREDRWRGLLRRRPFTWVMSAQPDFVGATRGDVRDLCQASGGRVDVDELMPAGTLLLRCSRPTQGPEARHEVSRGGWPSPVSCRRCSHGSDPGLRTADRREQQPSWRRASCGPRSPAVWPCGRSRRAYG